MSYNPFSLEGKTILITGASSGIGKATAIECSKLGARCIITGRNEKRLSETYSLLEGEGHLQIVSDLSNFSQIQKLVDIGDDLDYISDGEQGIDPNMFAVNGGKTLYKKQSPGIH